MNKGFRGEAKKDVEFYFHILHLAHWILMVYIS